LIGIVIIAHSDKLAQSVAELALEMGPDVPIAATGGTPDGGFGTNIELIRQAIESVYSDDGVLILMDLGSAIYTTGMAIEALPAKRRSNVRLCEAPLIEGALAAAITISAGGSLDEAVTQARGALAPKASDLGVEVPSAQPTAVATMPAQSIELTVTNPLGLHARPAAQFVRKASQFRATIVVRNVTRDTPPVDAGSINAVATLGVMQNHRIEIGADGPDAKQALDTLRALVESGFGEEEALPPPIPAPAPVAPGVEAESVLVGTPASPGVAIGPAVHWTQADITLPAEPAEDPRYELERLRYAVEATHRDIVDLRHRAEARIGAYQASILDAHLLFLDDPEIIGAAEAMIRDEWLYAETAWYTAYSQVADRYRSLDDPYMQARAADVEDVGRQVLRWLTGQVGAGPQLTEPGVIVASDLAPSDTATLDTQFTLGICTAYGGPTSHSAIMSRALGVPAVVGVGPELLSVPGGTLLVVDGETGHVHVAPTSKGVKAAEVKREAWLKSLEKARAQAQAPAITKDERRVEIAANVGRLADVPIALKAGADGIGLLRTEFLYLDRRTAPTEDEQVDAYSAILEAVGDRPVIIRTLDVGGDKPLPYIDLPQEANPFLGWRGLRLGLDRPDLLKTQLRAILRAGVGYGVRVMFPMVTTVDEVRRARALLDEAQKELSKQRVEYLKSVPVGIMIEVPAAALEADLLAAEVDFFSIGTNDLTQYTLAAERGHALLADFSDALYPSVLRLINRVVEEAHAKKKWVGLCGEIGGDPLAAPVLVGLGLDELSMNAASIPPVKQAIRTFTYKDAAKSAQAALGMESAAEVRRYLSKQFPDLSS
jgi:phosphoenolpyruvate-protein phosphotransferase/dihydroxyacetone kinase phosphotransfer subunit